MPLRPPFPCPFCPHVTWSNPKAHWDHLQQQHYLKEEMLRDAALQHAPDMHSNKGSVREVWELAELPGTFEDFVERMQEKYGDIT